MNKIESVFHTLLSEGNYVLYGPTMIADITRVLTRELVGGINQFLSEEYGDDVKYEVLKRIVWSYGRLRGKDFVRKSNAKMGSKSHETLRATLGVLGAAASHANNGGASSGGSNTAAAVVDEEEKNPRWQFLIKQPKPFLVNACKSRNLHYSGTKKVLTRRIIEHEAKQATERRGSIAASNNGISNSIISNNDSSSNSNSTTAVPCVTVFDAEEDVRLQGSIDENEKIDMELIKYFQDNYD